MICPLTTLSAGTGIQWPIWGTRTTSPHKSLANPLRFPRLDGDPMTESHQASQARKCLFSVPADFIGHYHKSHPITTSCKALHASNFPFKMGCWDSVDKRSTD